MVGGRSRAVRDVRAELERPTFENVNARNVVAVGVNNCGSFHFTPAGSEFAPADAGGNDGGGTTGPWLAAWELPNTTTDASGRDLAEVRAPAGPGQRVGVR